MISIDVIEIMLIKPYKKYKISDNTDSSSLESYEYPILLNFYLHIEVDIFLI